MIQILRSSLLGSAGFVHGFGTRKTIPELIPEALYTLRQVHGQKIIVLKNPLPARKSHFTEGDAIMTFLPNVFIGIRTADCLPVLMADPVSGAVAAVHCGWRSLAAELAGKAVRAFASFAETDPQYILAALGPSIERCCYEVGEDVREALMKIPDCGLTTEHRNGRIYASLKDAAASQLKSEGLTGENVDILDYCTSCRSDLLYSWRGEKTDKRMITFIGSKQVVG